jgi:non-lysosomal glucosylceramidase
LVADLDSLEKRTVDFVRDFCDSDLPDPVKESALFNVSTLRSQTCFQTPDGHLFGFEGCATQRGCCHGSCTHVWNYEVATPFLFGALARSMREIEFAHATDDQGLMSFRVGLPLGRARHFGKAAADGQMGCLLKIYREWQLSGDDQFLRSLWPQVRKALEFCWIPGGWDADRDGVMEGCQHNTMDVEYYGPNPQMEFWYLGALRAAEEMARHMGAE